jgi:hypothetical protein
MARNNERISVKAFWLMCLAMAVWLTGCVPFNEKGLMTYQDKISGDTTQMIADNKLPAPDGSTSEVWLDASRIVRPNGPVLYHLEAHYESRLGLLEIEMGETLLLNIDGKEYRYSGNGSVNFRKTIKDGLMTENAIYRVTQQDIRNIAHAKQVSLKLIGVKGSVARVFSPKNIESFKAFVETYLDK